MALDDDVRVLSRVGLFEGFTPEQLRLLAFGAETTPLPAERKLYREDDEADSAYVVVSGRIVLYREADGPGVPIGFAEAGSILGELALIADTRRLTSASAAADSQVLRLSRAMFRRILEEYPDIAVHLHQRIADELQALVKRIEELAPRFAG
ncbi:MAG: cyclic nucleotide-binding domain-containing protein [Mesorhizobium sp.]|nr:cyclic nucleotide-binding domain-containing protein [Mesorhizobium sp.]MBN9243840.1 cyclic nucleotide-binding domain-containing protein [Mesorhizobium sp.]MBN9272179.1 cyclic nucleotide-binding domain-containing protein [Mesorhizobium sp.]